MPFPFDSGETCPLAGGGHLVAEIGKINEFFDLAQSIRPWGKTFGGDRPGSRSAAVGSFRSQQTVQVQAAGSAAATSVGGLGGLPGRVLVSAGAPRFGAGLTLALALRRTPVLGLGLGLGFARILALTLSFTIPLTLTLTLTLGLSAGLIGFAFRRGVALGVLVGVRIGVTGAFGGAPAGGGFVAWRGAFAGLAPGLGLGELGGGGVIRTRGRGDFAGELVGEGIEFIASQAEGGGVVAEHPFGGAFDAPAEGFEAGQGALRGFAGFGAIALAEHFGSEFEGAGFVVGGQAAEAVVEGAGHAAALQEVLLELLGIAGFLLVQLAEGIVEVLGDQGFRGFGGLG